MMSPTDDGQARSVDREHHVHGMLLGHDHLEPPALPDALLEPWPVIVAITAGWLVALLLAFAVPSLAHWRPVTIAGLVVGAVGTSIFLLQRRAYRRGDRGAQRGLH